MMISQATGRPARGRTGTLTALLTAGLLLSGCGEDPEQTASEPTTSSTPAAGETPSPSATQSETADPGHADASPVYFVLDTRAGLRLAREPRDFSELGLSSVEAMIEGPQDPDYTSTWNPETEVLGVDLVEDGVIAVDLSAAAREANVGAPGAAAMVQQLVWTASEAIDPEAPVQLLIDGEPAGRLWGAVTWNEPIPRDPADEVRAFVGIDTPAEGSSLTSPLSVTGEANTFEANVLWRVLDEQGAEVESGFATSQEAFTFSPYQFMVDLPAGTYTVEVSEDDASGGEGGEPMRDTRTFTVE